MESIRQKREALAPGNLHEVPCLSTRLCCDSNDDSNDDSAGLPLENMQHCQAPATVELGPKLEQRMQTL